MKYAYKTVPLTFFVEIEKRPQLTADNVVNEINKAVSAGWDYVEHIKGEGNYVVLIFRRPIN